MAEAAHPRGGALRRRRRGRPVLGRTRVTKTTEMGTVMRPLRSVTRPALADGSPSAPRRGVRPRVPSPPDPAPSAHPGVPATNRRRGAGQTARARPSAPNVRRPRREHGEHRLMLTGRGRPYQATRSNRDVLLAITGIIAHKNQFRATSVRRESITP